MRKVDTQTGFITTIAGTCEPGAHASMSVEPVPERPEDDEDPLADPVSKPGDAYAQTPRFEWAWSAT